MNNEAKIKLFLVDDDIVFLKLLEIEFLEHADFDIETYVTGELCLENLSNNPDFIVLDYFLDGIDKTAKNGIDILDKILEVNPEIPVIMLSCQDKIEVAVDCMHHKAVDYVVKSETSFIRLKKIIKDLIEHRKLEKTLNWYMDRI
jgi:two-component system, OmpR family, response regulator